MSEEGKRSRSLRLKLEKKKHANMLVILLIKQ